MQRIKGKFRLWRTGRDDLLSAVEWTSKEHGDGAGYDIRSFDGKTDDELFIEVKTTNSGMYQPFLITQNEVAFSEKRNRNMHCIDCFLLAAILVCSRFRDVLSSM